MSPEQRRSTWTTGHFLLHTEPLAEEARHRRKHHPRGFSDLQEAKEYYDHTGRQPASALLIALVGLMRGTVNPERVLRAEHSRREARAALERLLAADGLNLTPAQQRKLRRALGLGPAQLEEPDEASPTYAAVFGPHDELIGFRNLATGELDELGGSGPQDEPPG